MEGSEQGDVHPYRAYIPENVYPFYILAPASCRVLQTWFKDLIILRLNIKLRYCSSIRIFIFLLLHKDPIHMCKLQLIVYSL